MRNDASIKWPYANRIFLATADAARPLLMRTFQRKPRMNASARQMDMQISLINRMTNFWVSVGRVKRALDETTGPFCVSVIRIRTV